MNNSSTHRRSALGHPATSPSPLRHASTASSNSSAYSASSTDSFTHRTMYNSHKRGLSEFSTTTKTDVAPQERNPASTYQNMRQSLRPLAQAPVRPPSVDVEQKPLARSTSTASHTHARAHSTNVLPSRSTTRETTPSMPQAVRPMSMALSRSDSVRRADVDKPGKANTHQVHFNPHIEKPELQAFQKSTTSHLRTLSKIANNAATEDFTINSPEQEVTGLQGRRRLQRGDSVRAKKSTSAWANRTWMDQQRQFLQAYEYLCHIGEAKEWIETILDAEIPPIVTLEETLRNGVTLAEVVQALCPQRVFRIFRHDKLQFRHSDNIAIFFRYLEEVELPDLFWFELVDLYEKKNIPKVIYCIHALSWLLFRKGITDFRIGNLVGQLQFEDHELEAMQKGLDKAGISLPNFSGMGANFGAEPDPEPEPIETEEERINRELAENEAIINDFQAQIRGALTRTRLGVTMQNLWYAEDKLIALQSKIRGDFAREITEYRLGRERFAVGFQAATRGFLARLRRRNDKCMVQGREKQIVKMQSAIRSFQARTKARRIQQTAQQHKEGVRGLQAAIRGALVRKDIGDRLEDASSAQGHVESLQAAVRGLLQRRMQQSDRTNLRQSESFVSKLQAAVRAAMVRGQHQVMHEEIIAHVATWKHLQALTRARQVRQRIEFLKNALHEQREMVSRLQAVIRGSRQRSAHADMLGDIAGQTPQITSLQTRIRGYLRRTRYHATFEALRATTGSTSELQSLVRGYLQRQKVYDLLCEVNSHDEEVMSLQSILRGALCRNRIDEDLVQLEELQDPLVEFQALIRGRLVQTKFAEKKRYFKENMEKVIKLQSFVRAKQQGEAYKTLIGGKNPPVGIVKNFVHLLNDSDFDFEEELEFEHLRKQVIQLIRQNELTEDYVSQIDLKIALLVKNKIDLDEVLKHQRHFGGNFGSLLHNKDLSSKDPFDLKALNKHSKKKLEHYQELFFLLQTQPQYMARLAKRMRERGMSEQETKNKELLFLGTFGFVQKRREEYYLLRMLSRCIKEEADSCATSADFLRGSFFWQRILHHRIRSPDDRNSLRELIGPVVKDHILVEDGVDLESDPLRIYRSAINNEELRTGQRSRRRTDLTAAEAIQDPETRATYSRNISTLRDIADAFLFRFEQCLQENLITYGIRYVAQQMFHVFRARFPHDEPQHLLLSIGDWVWKTYIKAGLQAPDTWGLVDRGLNPLQKRNLGEVCKVIGQIAAGRLFGAEHSYFLPINRYISDILPRVTELWSRFIDIPEPEVHFGTDEFNDLYARTKPTLYIKLVDIFAIHNLITQDLPYLCPNQDDVLREVMRELGSAKNNEHDMLHVTSTDITLSLNPKFHDIEDPDAAIKNLFMETKRRVLYIIRIQTGANLLEIMVRPITTEDEHKWANLVRDELNAERRGVRGGRTGGPANPYSEASALLDITTSTYTELKRTALENILTLEQAGRITRANHYQDVLNQIAMDIKTKHNRRQQRATEIAGVRQTMGALETKRLWLDSQLDSYNNYIAQAMITLQQKSKGRRRFLLPFTRQYNHERELEKSGRVPRFGSFKYSARNLLEKGVLHSWPGKDRLLEKIDVTIYSDEVGVFHIEASRGSTMIPGASATLTLEDLLHEQFENSQFINLFGNSEANVNATNGYGGGGGGSQYGRPSSARGDGPMRLNVNLLVHLIMRKFYKDG